MEFMMSHKSSLYHDFRMKGTEFFRNIYRASGLSIKQKTRTSKLDALKELVRSFGYDPEKVLVKDAFRLGLSV